MVTATAVLKAATSAPRRHGNHVAVAAATNKGRATGSAGKKVISALEGYYLVRVDGAEPLLRLHREGEQQRRHRGLDDHVGEGESLNYRVHHGGLGRDVLVNRRLGPGTVANRQQWYVARGL